MVEVTIATTENQMDPHAVTACLPWSGRGREGERRKRERDGDTFTTIVTVLTTATATYAPVLPVPSSRRGAPSQRNYAKSPTRKIRDTTSRRVPTCCIVISGNLPRTTCIRILRADSSIKIVNLEKAHRWLAFVPATEDARIVSREIRRISPIETYLYGNVTCLSESNRKPHFLSRAALIYAFVPMTRIIYLFIHLTLNIKYRR